MMWQPRRNHRDMQNRDDCIMRIPENIEPKSVFHFFEDPQHKIFPLFPHCVKKRQPCGNHATD